MNTNLMKCNILARIMANAIQTHEKDYIKGVALLRTPGSGAVHHLREALAQENHESVVIDLTMMNAKPTMFATPDENYARRIFNELYVHQDKVVIMYLNPQFSSVLGSLTAEVVKAALDITTSGRMSWDTGSEKIDFHFGSTIIFIVDRPEDLAPDIMDRCLLVDLAQ